MVAYANRANPYPLYAQLRETPISFQEGFGVVVSTHDLIATLLADPRLSAEERRSTQAATQLAYGGQAAA